MRKMRSGVTAGNAGGCISKKDTPSKQDVVAKGGVAKGAIRAGGMPPLQQGGQQKVLALAAQLSRRSHG
jgi:hypothetical protein